MPESDDLLANSERALFVADLNLSHGAPEVAAREAYMAALNAARAVIFEKTGKSSKTHAGTKATFNKLVHEGLAFPIHLLDLLKDGYVLKTDADYGSRKLADANAARSALETARAFVARCREIVAGG